LRSIRRGWREAGEVRFGAMSAAAEILASKPQCDAQRDDPTAQAEMF
jgi:hypothetical protein